MTKILITGSNSFVGRNFITNSVNLNVDEISLFNMTLDDIHFENYDVLIHLVAIVHQSKRIKEDQYFKINRDLCLSVAKKRKESWCKTVYFS